MQKNSNNFVVEKRYEKKELLEQGGGQYTYEVKNYESLDSNMNNNQNVKNVQSPSNNRNLYFNNNPPNNPQQKDIKKILQNYQYSLTNIISKNINSQIYRGREITSQKNVAIKVIPIPPPPSLNSAQSQTSPCTSKSTLLHKIQNQMKLLKQFSRQSQSLSPTYKNIIQVYDVYSTINNYYIIMQQCDMSLKEYLILRKVLTEEEVVDVLLGVMEGLKELDGKGYMHCDIKPSNVLLNFGKDKDKIRRQDMEKVIKDKKSPHNNNSPIKSVKLTDFALSRKLPSSSPLSPLHPTSSNNLSFQPNQWTPYMSPLTLVTKSFHQNNDIWSLFVMIYQCLHGYHCYPWKFQYYNDLLEKIYSDKGLEIGGGGKRISKQMSEFLVRGLSAKSSIGLKELYENEFVRREIEMRKYRDGQMKDETKLIENPGRTSLYNQKRHSLNNITTKSIDNDANYPNSMNTQLKKIISHQTVVENNTKNYLTSNGQQINNNYGNLSTEKYDNNQKHHQKLSTSKPVPIKQLMDCQVSFMRFLNIILKRDQRGYVEQYFPNSCSLQSLQNNIPSTLPKQKQQLLRKSLDHKLFRFILIKQTLTQKQSLKQTIDLYSQQNPFNFDIELLNEYLIDKRNKQDIQKLRKLLGDYDKKYSGLEEEMERLVEEILRMVEREGIRYQWRSRDILTVKLERKEIYVLMGVRLAREYCKYLWREIEVIVGALRNIRNSSNNSNRNLISQSQSQQKTYLLSQIQQKCLRIDFLMTYYILNCLLVDNFTDLQYFSKKSGLNIIMNNVPIRIGQQNIGLIKQKLRILEII